MSGLVLPRGYGLEDDETTIQDAIQYLKEVLGLDDEDSTKSSNNKTRCSN
jgi:hypothetical protein